MLKSVAANLGTFGARVAAAAPVVARDLIALGAVGLIAYGAWLVYLPAGFIVGGALLLTGALLTAKR